MLISGEASLLKVQSTRHTLEETRTFCHECVSHDEICHISRREWTFL